MPDRVPCQHCGKSGFVRIEHVIQGASAFLYFCCGLCTGTWEQVDRRAAE